MNANLSYIFFRQTSENFTEFWAELKKKLDLVKSSSTNYEEHDDFKACLQKYWQEELISYLCRFIILLYNYNSKYTFSYTEHAG